MRALLRDGFQRWTKSPVLGLAIFFAVAAPIINAQTITLSSSSVTFSSTAAQPQAPSQSITITNSGVVAMTGVQVTGTTYTAGQPTGWLTTQNTSGPNTTIQPNGSNAVNMTASSGSLPAGTYTASFQITSANAPNSPRTVNVTFTVAGPTMQLNQSAATFQSTAAQPTPPLQIVTVTNAGSSVMTGVQLSAVTYAPGQPTNWLTIQNTSGPNTSVQPGASNAINMSVSPGTLPAGTYTATFVVSSTNATNGPFTVTVTFIVAGPSMSMSSTNFSFASTAAVPNPASQSATITNVGSSTMTGVNVSAISYGPGQPTGWLFVQNTSGANTSIQPGSSNALSMSLTTGSLPAGTYTASYVVSATNATTAPVTVNVSFTVAGASLSISGNTASFASTAAQPQPPTQSLTVTNVGSSVMTGVQVSPVSYTAGQPTGWLFVQNTSGSNTSIQPGGTNSLSMSVTPGLLPTGTYTASYTVSATSASGSPVTVTVTLTVSGPSMQISGNAASFNSTAALPQPGTQALTVSNIGSTTMTGVQVSAITYAPGQPTGWLFVQNTSGTNTSIQPGGSNSLSMSVTPGSLRAGTYNASYTVTANSAANAPQTVNVTFTVFGPAIQLSATSATFASFVGQPSPPLQTITIGNVGSTQMAGVNVSAVTYPAGQPSGWLSLQNTSGTNTSINPGGSNTINLSVTSGTVPVGTHTATFQVSSTNSNNGPSLVTVTLVQNPAPAIQFSPTSTTFTASRNGANPAAGSVNVTAVGITDLIVQSIAYSAGQPTGWLVATLANAAAPTTLNMQATTGSLAVGTYTATVTVSSAASGAINTLPVSFNVTAAPAISIAANTNVSAVQGQVGTANLFIGNGGGGTLNALSLGAVAYGAGQPTGWLTAQLTNTTAPTTVGLSASAVGLNPGVYTATIPISSTAQGVSNSPQTATVTFTVTVPLAPTITLSSAFIAFNAQAATSSPVAQTVNITNSGTGTLSGLAAGAITYGAGQPTGWLSASLNTTTAPATLTITPTLGALTAGNYSATVPVSSTAANVTNSPRTITVNFAVTAAPLPPTIQLSPSQLNFSAPVNGANPASQVVNVGNAGSGTVNGLAVGTITYGATQPTGWLSASLNSSTSPATLTVNAVTAALPVGTYNATIPVTSTNAVNSPANVTVTFTVTPVPTIALSANAVEFNAATGGANPGQQNIAITNSGTGTLAGLVFDAVVYPAGQPIGWLAPSLSGTTAPATLALQVNNTSFPPGDYTATLAVRASGASNSPQTITVTYHLAGQPAIALSASSLSFSAVSGGANPGSQLITVSNGGTGSLTGLTIGSITYGPGATGWLAATPSGTTAPINITVQPTVGTLAAGTYSATVIVTATSANNSPRQFTVQLVVTAPVPTQSIVVTPGTIMISMQTKSPSTRTVTAQITNGGSGVLSGLQSGAPTYVSGAGWLSATLGSSTTPAVLTLRGSTRTLNPGMYEATLPISTPSVTTLACRVLLEVVDLKASERALTDAAQLPLAERTRLDQLGNNDGTYNLGDYVALRARLGLP